MVTGASWNLLPAPQCGAWGLTLPRTLTMIRLTVGELNEKNSCCFLIILALSPGAGESSGTIMEVDVEYVEMPGGIFPESMRHP